MKHLMKHIGMSLAAFGLASSAHAASFAVPECPCDITIPKYDGNFRLAFEALYFSPTMANNVYATRELSLIPFESKTHANNFDYDWGLRVEGSYLFPATGNDVLAAWTDIEMDDRSNQTLVASANGLALNPTEIPFVWNGNFDFLAAAQDLNISSRYDVDYQAFDLEVGQAIVFMERVMMRFHAGIRYADIETELRINASQSVGGGNFDVETQTATSEWDGVGIRAGANAAWDIGHGFHITGAASAAALVGSVDRRATSFYEDTGVPASVVEQEIKADYDTRVVPNVEARLGVSYTHAFVNQSELSLELGYQIANYFDVDHKLSSAGTDIGMHGGYIRLLMST